MISVDLDSRIEGLQDHLEVYHLWPAGSLLECTHCIFLEASRIIQNVVHFYLSFHIIIHHVYLG
jgi:hypothetical protein